MTTAISRFTRKSQTTLPGVVLEMITSARNSNWPLDTEIVDKKSPAVGMHQNYSKIASGKH